MPKVSNVYQDKKSKKWYFVANLGYDHEGKRIRHWERGFATQKDAKIAYSKYMNDFSDSAVKMNSTMSYKEFLYSYFLPDMEKDVCDSTYRARLSYIKVHFCYFFNVKLKDITAPMIKKWQNSLSEKYSSAYVNKIYTTFRISLDLAVQLNLLKENVARKVITRARLAYKNSGIDPDDHFADVRKMVEIGSGAHREVDDVTLSRYACYLIVVKLYNQMN